MSLIVSPSFMNFWFQGISWAFIFVDNTRISFQLAELQRKVRSDVSSEYWFRVYCASPEKQLFDWGMMRLRRPLYGVGDAFAIEADDHLKKKRDSEVISFAYLLLMLGSILIFKKKIKK